MERNGIGKTGMAGCASALRKGKGKALQDCIEAGREGGREGGIGEGGAEGGWEHLSPEKKRAF